MTVKLIPILFSLLILLGGATCAAAQEVPDASTRTGKPRPQEDLPKGIKENLLKRKLDQEKKEFDEMLKRGEEAAKLSEEINTSFEKNNALNSEDQKKLERLEKLVKKIRDGLGGEDDKEENVKERPADLVNALKSVHENAVTLLSALKKTTRLTISAAAIESSNAVLKLLRFIRFTRN
jgi:seryl-tRNA synthetase